MATRTLENRNDRLLTMLIIPFMSCSARLPVYVLITGAIFPGHAGNVIFLLYMTGVLFSLLMSVVFKNILFRKQQAPFVMELPVYRSPGIRIILRHMWGKGEHYLRKMGGVILLASVVIWALGYFPRNVPYSKEYGVLVAIEQDRIHSDPQITEEVRERVAALEREKESERQAYTIIGRLGVMMVPVFEPLGFDWKMGVALLTGFAAKEIVVSTMGVLYQANDQDPPGGSSTLQSRIREQVYVSGPRTNQAVFTPLASLSFLVFVLIYLPCIAVIVTVGKESGSWKWAGFVLFYTSGLAWLASFALFQIGSLIQMG
jgi:ferrous iron transport protein B